MLVAVSGFALAASFLPDTVPFQITPDQAAAPHASLSFMFWGTGTVVLPITPMIYRIFKGKVAVAAEHD